MHFRRFSPSLPARRPMTLSFRASRVLAYAAVTGIAALAGGCDEKGGGDGIVGPCVHIYEDAVLHVQSARDKETGAPIDTLFITAVTVDSVPYDLGETEWEENATGVERFGDSLRCVLPFAFGTDEGRWTLAVSAAGHPEQYVEFDARYAVFRGGCPSWNDSGTVVELELHATPFDLEPFKEIVRGGICADIRNRIFLIDDALVFLDREGNCQDAAYGYLLFGSTPEMWICYRCDSIGGVREAYRHDGYRAFFETILANLDRHDLGLGPSHTVEQIPF